MDVRLIDANALLEMICKKCPEYDCKPDATDTVSGCLIYDVIASTPTIDAQPVKHGYWKRNESGELNCSYCGYEPKWDDDNFCACCGAKMHERAMRITLGSDKDE